MPPRHTHAGFPLNLPLHRVLYRLVLGAYACAVARDRAGECIASEQRATVMQKLQRACLRRRGCTCLLMSEASWQAMQGAVPGTVTEAESAGLKPRQQQRAQRE